jgi:N-alpha-acetyl-L-2,4-diaminobutyrate deacetylase
MGDRLHVTPAELDLVSPGRRDYWVGLAHDTLWAEWFVPVTVFVGPEARDGEGLVAFGSTHGNEYEGPVVIKHLLHELELERVRGRIVLVPVLNPAALREGTRDGAGVNLNRAFVDGAGSTPPLADITHRIARLVREQIWPHVNVVLDIHSGGRVMRFAHVSSMHHSPDPAQMARAADTARWFGTPFVMVYQNEYPGLLTSEAENMGKITVGTELGWGAAVDEDGVVYGRQGILGAAAAHGFLDLEVEPIAHHRDGSQLLVDISRPPCAVYAPWPGCYEPVVRCGTAVSAGETLGYLHDFDRIDEAPWPARAAVDGHVICQAWEARVVAGQQIAMVGLELPWPT